MEGKAVILNVYDLSTTNSWTSYLGLGAYHSGVVVGGYEYTFAKGGIVRHRPRVVPESVVYRCDIAMGIFYGGVNDLNSVVASMRDLFPGDSYHLTNKNCNHFTNAFCERLVGRSIPDWVNRTASWTSYFLSPSDPTMGSSDDGNGMNPNERAKMEAERTQHKKLTEKQKQMLEKFKQGASSSRT